MRAGILAAGTGERLKAAGIQGPKALVRVGGTPLVERLLGELGAAGVTEAVGIVNEQSEEVIRYVQGLKGVPPTRWIMKTTASSLESLYAIASELRGEPYLLTTVDSVYPPRTLARFAERAQAVPAADVVLAITDFVDDEKPLRLLFAPGGRVTALGQSVRNSHWVTAGFYWISAAVQSSIERSKSRNLASLRWLLQAFVEDGLRVYAMPVPKTVDVDRPEDIARAEEMLKQAANSDATR